MGSSNKLEILSELDTEIVSGGTSIPGIFADQSEYWQDQLLRYKMGLSSIFGPETPVE